MSDFLDLQGAKDLNTDAIHIGAVANSVDPVTGAPIDTHVNRVGGTDYTLQGFWNALGPVVMPWTSITGGTLTQPNQAFLHPTDKNYYSWVGAYPVGGYVVAPGTDPTTVTGYVPRTDVVLRQQLIGGGSLGAPNNVIIVDLPPFNGDIDAAINSVTGNTTFILGNKTYVSNLWGSGKKNIKPGIKIIGSGVPIPNAAVDKLEDGTGTIIRGAIKNSAKGFEIHNLGIDLGDYTRINLREGVYEDALVNYNFGDNAGIKYGNLIILESAGIDGVTESYTHCHLAEIGSGITVTGPLEIIRGGHGYVVKCKDFDASGQSIRVYGQILDSYIVKSDAAAKVFNVHLGHVRCGKTGFTTRPGYLEGHSSNSTDGVYFDSLTGLRNEGLLQGAAGSTGYITNVHIPVIDNMVSYGSNYNVVVPNKAVDWHIGIHEFNQCSGGLKVEAGAANIFIGDGIVKGSTTHGYDLNGTYKHGNLMAYDNAGFGVNRSGGDGLDINRISGRNNSSGLVSSIPSAISGLANGWTAQPGSRFAVDVIGRTVHISGRLSSANATAGSIAAINQLYRPTTPCSIIAIGLLSGGARTPILCTVETDGRIELGGEYAQATGGVVDIFGSYTF